MRRLVLLLMYIFCLLPAGAVAQRLVPPPSTAIPQGAVTPAYTPAMRLFSSAPGQSVEHRRRSPALAWFLSFLVPGAGQGYNGQWGKAAVFFTVFTTGVVLSARKDGDLDCIMERDETCGAAETAGAWMWLGGWVGAQIDAPLTAAAMNRRSRATSGRVSIALLTFAF